MKYEVGFDFTNDWKGIKSFNTYEEAIEFYLIKFNDEYHKLLSFSKSLCIKDKEINKKYFLELKEDELRSK